MRPRISGGVQPFALAADLQQNSAGQREVSTTTDEIEPRALRATSLHLSRESVPPENGSAFSDGSGIALRAFVNRFFFSSRGYQSRTFGGPGQEAAFLPLLWVINAPSVAKTSLAARSAMGELRRRARA